MRDIQESAGSRQLDEDGKPGSTRLQASQLYWKVGVVTMVLSIVYIIRIHAGYLQRGSFFN